MSASPIFLTDFSHGAGCGCKISPEILSKILEQNQNPNESTEFENLVVGNESNDDAAAIRINDKQVILSTTDFFMPIVDDPFDFGRIAATNAISDIYAMGGSPLLAVAILSSILGVSRMKRVRALLLVIHLLPPRTSFMNQVDLAKPGTLPQPPWLKLSCCVSSTAS